MSISTSLCVWLWHEHLYNFYVFGVESQLKSFQLKQISPYHLYTSGVACWEVTWPPNQILSVHWDITGQITLVHHWGHKYTGMPLEPHWLMLTPRREWCPSGDPVLICTILEHTGRPLEPQVHWDATATTLAYTSTQWGPSGDPVLICIIGTLEHHWKATGRPLEAHWLKTIISPVAFHCTLGSEFQAHLIAAGLPLNDHWLSVMVHSCTTMR